MAIQGTLSGVLWSYLRQLQWQPPSLWVLGGETGLPESIPGGVVCGERAWAYLGWGPQALKSSVTSSIS